MSTDTHDNMTQDAIDSEERYRSYYDDYSYDDPSDQLEDWADSYPPYTDFDVATDATYRDILAEISYTRRHKLKLIVFRTAFFIRGHYRIWRYRLNKLVFYIQTGRDLDKELPF